MTRFGQKILLCILLTSFLAQAFIFVPKAEAVFPVFDAFAQAQLIIANTLLADIAIDTTDIAVNTTVSAVADPITAANTTIKNTTDVTKKILNVVAGVLAKRLLDMIVDQTTAWIQGGGKPKFVTNWEQFAKDAAQAAGGDVANVLGLGFLCSNFDLNVRIILRNQTFSERVTCTIDQIVGNIESFYNNFLDGGWIAYSEIWSHPANNYYGAVLIAAQEQSTRAASKLEAAINEGIAGGGYLSTKKKIADASRSAVGTIGGSLGLSDKFSEKDKFQLKQEELQRRIDKAKAEHGGIDVDDLSTAENTGDLAAGTDRNFSAPPDEEITTQGSSIGATLNRSLQSGFNILENAIGADTLSAYASAIADAALNRLIKAGVDGIKSLSTPNAPPGNIIPPNTGDACSGLEGDNLKACNELNSIEKSSFVQASQQVKSAIEKEVVTIKTAPLIASSSLFTINQISVVLNDLLNCQNSKKIDSSTTKILFVKLENSKKRWEGIYGIYNATSTPTFQEKIASLNARLNSTPLNDWSALGVLQNEINIIKTDLNTQTLERENQSLGNVLKNQKEKITECQRL